MTSIDSWSEIEVANVQESSRLVSAKSVQPLKIFNPTSYCKTCHVMLSNYGGGMVSGDKINLAINCQDNSQLFLNTQANGRVFKTLDNKVAEQTIKGTVGENSIAVLFPDPIVLHSESTFHQIQHWDVKKSSLLFLVDWFNSGRMDMGEKFEFHSFKTALKVQLEGKTILQDQFCFDPKHNIATSPANFANYQTFFSAYLIGCEDDMKFIALNEKLLKLKTKAASDINYDLLEKSSLVSVSRVKRGVIILRALGKSRTDLQPIYEKIIEALSSKDILDYHPLKRKF